MLKYGHALPACVRLRVGHCRGRVMALPRSCEARPAVREKGDAGGYRELRAGRTVSLSGGSWAPEGTRSARLHCRGRR
jgi:hypothetical protein